MYGDARKKREEKICVINDQLAPSQAEEVNHVSAQVRASSYQPLGS